MPNDGMRKPGDPLDDAEIASTSVAVPTAGATWTQVDKGREIAQTLNRDDLTMYVTAKDGDLKELPIGEAIRILCARKAITDEMAVSLEVLYRATLARLEKTEDEVRQGCENPTGQEAEIVKNPSIYRTVLDTIRDGAREKLPNPSSGKMEKNSHYGDFSYYIDLEGRATRVSIIEAIAWLEHKGHLDATQANRLQAACKASMRNIFYRQHLRRKLTKEEIENELADLDIKAAEIVKPKEIKGKTARLEAQLDEGDFTLYIETPFGEQKERPFLEGIFYYKKAGTLSAETAMRLAKLCIDKMLQYGHRQNAIVDTIDFMFMAHIITPEELSELINYLIPDSAEAAKTIKRIVDLASDDEAQETIVDDTDDGGVDIDVSGLADEGRPAGYSGPPVPAAFTDARKADITGVRMPDSATGPFQEVSSAAIIDTGPLDDTPPAGTRLPAPSRIKGYPGISRLITGRRLAFVAAGLLGIVSGATIVTSIGKRPGANTVDATVAVGIASTETGSEPELEPQIIDPARLAGEQSRSEDAEGSRAEAPGEKKADTKKEKPATAPTRAATTAPRPATAPTPEAPATTVAAAPAPTPAPQAAQPDLTDAPPLVPLTRPAQTIRVPVTIKPSAASGGFKIDTVTSRQQWEAMGYRVSVSMGLTGKIIRLTDSKGNVYQVAAENLAANTATLPATLRTTE